MTDKDDTLKDMDEDIGNADASNTFETANNLYLRAIARGIRHLVSKK